MSKKHKKFAKELERLRKLHGGLPPQEGASPHPPENSVPLEKGVTLGVTKGVTNVPPPKLKESPKPALPKSGEQPAKVFSTPAVSSTEEGDGSVSAPVKKAASSPYAYVKRDLTFSLVLMAGMIGLLLLLGWLFSQTAVKEMLLKMLG